MAERYTRFSCYGPIEQARINVLGPSVQTCAKCAYTANAKFVTTTPTPTRTYDATVKATPPKRVVYRRLLQCVLFDGEQKKVMAPTTVVHKKLTLNVLFEGDIWGTTIQV